MSVPTVLAAVGQGLALLTRPAAAGVPGTVAVPIARPRVVHRKELVCAGTPNGASAEFVDLPVRTASRS